MLTSTVLDYRKVAATVFMQSVQEILGGDALTDYFSAPAGRGAGLLSDTGRLLDHLERTYGESGGQGLAVRIGRSIFKNGLAALGEQAGFRAMEYRMLPSPRRIENGLHTLASIAKEACQDEVVVSDQGTSWQLRSAHCLACQGRKASKPTCFWVIGFLQEYSSWAGGGRFYRVTEMECRALGAPACVYQIDKQPLD